MDKRQLQEMLREMKVSYPPEATEAELADMLRQENRRQWMKPSAVREVKTRKRSEKGHSSPPAESPKPRGLRPKAGAVGLTRTPPSGPKFTYRGMIQKKPAAPRTPELDPEETPGLPAAAEAAGTCDRCAKTSPGPGEPISAYSFSDQPALRNTVFLCPECTKTINAQQDGRDIRLLKRKARLRADSRLQVSYGKVKHTWGYKP